MADFQIYNKPVCNTHGQIIIKLKRDNPQAFINWKTLHSLLSRDSKAKLNNAHPLL
jgi:hypothetical protein